MLAFNSAAFSFTTSLGDQQQPQDNTPLRYSASTTTIRGGLNRILATLNARARRRRLCKKNCYGSAISSPQSSAVVPTDYGATTDSESEGGLERDDPYTAYGLLQDPVFFKDNDPEVLHAINVECKPSCEDDTTTDTATITTSTERGLNATCTTGRRSMDSGVNFGSVGMLPPPRYTAAPVPRFGYRFETLE